jgi:hypothetical protein
MITTTVYYHLANTPSTRDVSIYTIPQEDLYDYSWVFNRGDVVFSVPCVDGAIFIVIEKKW